MMDELDIREKMKTFYSGQGRTFSSITTTQDDEFLLEPRFRELALRLYKNKFQFWKVPQETKTKN